MSDTDTILGVSPNADINLIPSILRHHAAVAEATTRKVWA